MQVLQNWAYVRATMLRVQVMNLKEFVKPTHLYYSKFCSLRNDMQALQPEISAQVVILEASG